MKVLVAGGTGFLGLRICEAAVRKGFDVVGVSRKGAPEFLDRAFPPSWSEKVTWVKGDLDSPASLDSHLKDADAVVHSVGIISELDYKKLMKEDLGPKAAVEELLKLGKQALMGANPMNTRSYMSVNCDSAVNLAKQFAKTTENPDKKSFVYISAFETPLVPKGYIESKIAAELRLKQFPWRNVFFRPGFMYDHFRPQTEIISRFVDCAYDASRQLGINALAPALDTVTVASAVANSIADSTIDGVVTVHDIPALSR
ncbi:hypothetical protein CANCADRAFT_84534 [Tortispora caseinolytica NRRL Y-17796]|uniref:NAD-dependent epimerase/dehydratase domain-containing protein n=1 Tax=Tortispora caseinolytica NRRL Y-17796 TaxID=767744 RepID=A0A1E4TKK9_9ASCO|nr:hypothetical protein CANCADRAFT_84534 [Tortispora caseinolytica NRRL Y-17796]